ncbi:MAG: hypothetical protein ACRBBJ_08960 [Rhodomicrobiaceae bacterium]
MSDDITNTTSNTNSSKTRQDFTKARQQQAYEVSKLSQAAQEKAAKIDDIYTKRLNSERKDQQKHRSYRELKTKAQLMENYIRSDEPRPNTPEARENDLKIIDEQTKRRVQERESFYLQQIERQHFKTIKEQVIQEEQQKQQEPTPEQSTELTEPELEQEM